MTTLTKLEAIAERIDRVRDDLKAIKNALSALEAAGTEDSLSALSTANGLLEFVADELQFAAVDLEGTEQAAERSRRPQGSVVPFRPRRVDPDTERTP